MVGFLPMLVDDVREDRGEFASAVDCIRKQIATIRSTLPLTALGSYLNSFILF
jgi:hypothetical protein